MKTSQRGKTAKQNLWFGYCNKEGLFCDLQVPSSPVYLRVDVSMRINEYFKSWSDKLIQSFMSSMHTRRMKDRSRSTIVMNLVSFSFTKKSGCCIRLLRKQFSPSMEIWREWLWRKKPLQTAFQGLFYQHAGLLDGGRERYIPSSLSTLLVIIPPLLPPQVLDHKEGFPSGIHLRKGMTMAFNSPPPIFTWRWEDLHRGFLLHGGNSKGTIKLHVIDIFKDMLGT